jgi:hypothetical protein
MPLLDLPPQLQERVVCSITAAVKYEVPANIVLAIAEREGGKAGQWVENSNGTHDVGPMQFNTAYLADLAKYGITAQDVAQGGCYSYDLAAWRLRGHIRNDRGDIWTRAANYHSRTPEYNAVYRDAIMKRGAEWESWLEARFPTFDATRPGSGPAAGTVEAAEAPPEAGQGVTTPGPLATSTEPSNQPVPVVDAFVTPLPASSPRSHYNAAAAAALAAVFAPALLQQKVRNATAVASEP